MWALLDYIIRPPRIAYRLGTLCVALHVIFLFLNRVAAGRDEGFGFRIWREGDIEEKRYAGGYRCTYSGSRCCGAAILLVEVVGMTR
jgi:hypothetical protein